MATKNTILGTVPKSRGRYTEGDTTTKWYYDNILEYKGSSFRCISETSTGITGAPATYNSDTHTLVPNAGWEFFVDTTGALDVEEKLTENKEKLSELESKMQEIGEKFDNESLETAFSQPNFSVNNTLEYESAASFTTPNIIKVELKGNCVGQARFYIMGKDVSNTAISEWETIDFRNGVERIINIVQPIENARLGIYLKESCVFEYFRGYIVSIEKDGLIHEVKKNSENIDNLLKNNNVIKQDIEKAQQSIRKLNEKVFNEKHVALEPVFNSGDYFGSQGEFLAGGESPSSRYAVVNLPVVKEGAKVYVRFTNAPVTPRHSLLAKSSSVFSSGYYVVKYNEIYQKISEENLALQDDGTYLAEFTMPSDAEYLLISYYSDANNFISAEIVYEDAEQSAFCALKGKKWCVCGDSYTFGDYDTEGSTVPDDEKYIKEGRYKGYRVNYGNIIGNQYDMDIDINAKNGATMVTVGGSGFSKWDGGRKNIPSYELIPLDADYITLAFGLNEITTKTQLKYSEGDKLSTDATTIWGAWNKVIEYIQTNIPNAKLGVIIMDGWMTEQYRTLLKSICKYWGVPYLDLFEHMNVCLVTPLAGEAYETLSPRAVELRNALYDGGNTHPSPFANYKRATVIAEWLKSL